MSDIDEMLAIDLSKRLAAPPSQPLAAIGDIDPIADHADPIDPADEPDDRCRCVRWRQVIVTPWLEKMDWTLSEKFFQCAACGRLRPRG